jgi:hypothetical protein
MLYFAPYLSLPFRKDRTTKAIHLLAFTMAYIGNPSIKLCRTAMPINFLP